MGAKLFIAVATIALVTAGTAHADPTGDYLGILGNSPGFIGGPVNNAIYIGAGNNACNDLRNGATPQDAAAHITIGPVTPYLATTMVTAAQSTLCPDTKH